MINKNYREYFLNKIEHFKNYFLVKLRREKCIR